MMLSRESIDTISNIIGDQITMSNTGTHDNSDGQRKLDALRRALSELHKDDCAETSILARWGL